MQLENDYKYILLGIYISFLAILVEPLAKLIGLVLGIATRTAWNQHQKYIIRLLRILKCIVEHVC